MRGWFPVPRAVWYRGCGCLEGDSNRDGFKRKNDALSGGSAAYREETTTYPTTAGNQSRTREERTSTPPLLRFLGMFSRLWALRSQAQRLRTRLTAASGWGGGCCSFVVGKIRGWNLNRGRGRLQGRERVMAGGDKSNTTPIQAADAVPGQSPATLALTARRARGNETTGQVH